MKPPKFLLSVTIADKPFIIYDDTNPTGLTR